MRTVSTGYQLWEGGSAIGSFATQDEAMAVVRHALEAYGSDELMEISLWSLSSDRKLTLVADGETLTRKCG